MGAYVSPPNKSTTAGKIAWLQKNGKLITRREAELHNDFTENFLVVVLDNVRFIDCGIAFDEDEKRSFMSETDRLGAFFVVPKEPLLKVSNLEFYLKKEG